MSLLTTLAVCAAILILMLIVRISARRTARRLDDIELALHRRMDRSINNLYRKAAQEDKDHSDLL